MDSIYNHGNKYHFETRRLSISQKWIIISTIVLLFEATIASPHIDCKMYIIIITVSNHKYFQADNHFAALENIMTITLPYD